MGRMIVVIAFAVLATSVNCLPDQENKVTGRGITDVAKNMWQYFFGSNDYDYSDYVDYQAGSEDVSSYTFYNPDSARRESFDVAGEDEYSWSDMALGAATFIVPAILLFSAFNPLPANLFTIAVKKRSFDNGVLDNLQIPEITILKTIQESEFMNILRPSCQKKLFCEISQLGKQDSATLVQKAFYYVSHLTPENVSRSLYMDKVFNAARSNQCEIFTCSKNRLHVSPSNSIDELMETA